MDPLTQGLAGAALPQAAARRGAVAIAGLLGFLAGMTPDLDVLIRSSEDPLLFLEYHRQFTHSLVFIPVGGALCALLLHPLLGRRRGLAPLTTAVRRICSTLEKPHWSCGQTSAKRGALFLPRKIFFPRYARY